MTLPFDPAAYVHEQYIDNLEDVDITGGKRAKRVVLYDSSGNEILGGAGSAIGDNRQTVTTAGTRVQLSAASVPCKKVVISALQGNSGVIVVGGITVVASAATRRGIPLNPLDTITVEVSNLNLIYLDSSVNGEGVSYLYTA